MRIIPFFLVSVLCLQAQNGSEPSQQDLLVLVQKLQARVDKLEQLVREKEAPPPVSVLTPATLATPATATQAAPAPVSASPGILAGTTFGVTLDGYYEYNLNKPLGRVNLLRADDPTANNFSLNQASFVIDHEPDVAAGKRFGVRVDLQYGQATESVQGSPGQEPRPQVYRPLWQAYGTYVFPVGTGLTVDFGKWAGSLGAEGNYNKDQINYTRAYLFNFLPFYHFGSRTTYNFNDKVALSWWLVNGIGQSEDFNNFKSTAFLWTLKPTKTLSWNVNYYVGQEGHDVVPNLNPEFPLIASQPGLSVIPVSPVPNGRTHIFDSYATWTVTPKLTLLGEGDYVVARNFSNSSPSHVSAGAVYARYQLTPRLAIASRAEYLSDRGGLFSSVSQALKETTGTIEYKFVDGFLVRGEWRRDFSNHLFFLTDRAGILQSDQNTAALGMVWWFGNKEGAW